MTTGAYIDFPKEDVKDLFRQIERAQTELGKSLSNSVRWGGWFVAKSLGAATSVPASGVVKSGKRRSVEEVRGEGRARRGALKTFRAKRYRKGGRVSNFTFQAKSKSEANKSKLLKISYWGLAKASWMWAVKPLGAGSTFGFATSKAKDKAARAVEVIYRKDKHDPMVKITNRLPYIREALSGGEARVSEAIGKASRNMERSIEKAVEKKLLKGIR